MAESWTAAELLRAGWREADLDWESATARLFEFLAADDAPGAREKAAFALQIARQHFSKDDPRLGTAIANFATCLEMTGDTGAAEKLRPEAAAIWRGCGPWIARMRAPRTARSSLYHMRMEQRHRDTYETRWREKWQELAAEARARVDQAAAGGETIGDILARWRRECPAMLNDTRKLMAATILIAPRPRKV